MTGVAKVLACVSSFLFSPRHDTSDKSACASKLSTCLQPQAGRRPRPHGGPRRAAAGRARAEPPPEEVVALPTPGRQEGPAPPEGRQGLQHEGESALIILLSVSVSCWGNGSLRRTAESSGVHWTEEGRGGGLRRLGPRRSRPLPGGVND
jgi:hypothetical protein